MIKRKINTVFFSIVILSAFLNIMYIILEKNNFISVLFIIITMLQILLYIYIIYIYRNNKMKEKTNVYIKNCLLYLLFLIILIVANTIKYYNYIGL